MIWVMLKYQKLLKKKKKKVNQEIRNINELLHDFTWKKHAMPLCY